MAGELAPLPSLSSLPAVLERLARSRIAGYLRAPVLGFHKRGEAGDRIRDCRGRRDQQAGRSAAVAIPPSGGGSQRDLGQLLDALGCVAWIGCHCPLAVVEAIPLARDLGYGCRSTNLACRPFSSVCPSTNCQEGKAERPHPTFRAQRVGCAELGGCAAFLTALSFSVTIRAGVRARADPERGANRLRRNCHCC